MDNDDIRVGDMTVGQLMDLSKKTVDKYYNGKRGCMCGCLGEYYCAKDAANIRRINSAVKRLLNNPDAVLQDGYILYLDTPTRISCVYFNQ